MPQAVKIAAVQLLIFAVAIVCIEFALRYLAPLPVHGGIFVDGNGKQVRVAKDEALLKPNLRATHISSEFSARVAINARGYRTAVNESAQPDYLFLGDSFTFGHGVSDEEVFSSLLCKERAVSCLNLGRSGTNTFQQLKILRYALHRGIRPKTVVLVMLTACWVDSAGNDLGDNLLHYRSQNESVAAAGVPTAQGRALSGEQPSFSANDLIQEVQRRIGHFEIVRRTMLIIASRLKSSVYACSDAKKIAAAMEATRAALNELQRVADETPFEVAVLAIHPYQELDGSYSRTERELTAIMPHSFAFTGTGAHFRKDQYFLYDGHFNAAGHANMARVLEAVLKPQ